MIQVNIMFNERLLKGTFLLVFFALRDDPNNGYTFPQILIENPNMALQQTNIVRHEEETVHDICLAFLLIPDFTVYS